MRVGCGSKVTAIDLACQAFGALHNLAENGAVRAVDAVKVADTDERGAEVAGTLRVVKDCIRVCLPPRRRVRRESNSSRRLGVT